MKIKYCLGFVFNVEKTHVLLIRKNRPEWQAGNLNGIGGKVEPGETYLEAMVRETEEETGLVIEHWTAFANMSGKHFSVECFHAESESIFKAQSLTDEVVTQEIIDFNTFFREGNPNVGALISQALRADSEFLYLSTEPRESSPA